MQEQSWGMVDVLCGISAPAGPPMIEQYDAQGLTPLGQAVSWNYLDCVRIMLQCLG